MSAVSPGNYNNHCGHEVRFEMKFCPSCGADCIKPTSDLICSKCGEDIQFDWNACPACGTPVNKKTFCVECGMELDAEWKVCPRCQTRTDEEEPVVVEEDHEEAPEPPTRSPIKSISELISLQDYINEARYAYAICGDVLSRDNILLHAMNEACYSVDDYIELYYACKRLDSPDGFRALRAAKLLAYTVDQWQNLSIAYSNNDAEKKYCKMKLEELRGY